MKRHLLCGVAALLLIVTLSTPAMACCFLNKDVHNNTGQSAYDLEIVFEGTRTVMEHYDGHPLGFSSFDTWTDGGNTYLRWYDPYPYAIPPCEWVHIGYRLDEPARIIDVWWTDQNGLPIGPILQPGHWVYYYPEPPNVLLKLAHDLQVGSPMTISDIYYTILPAEIPLDSLNANNVWLESLLTPLPGGQGPFYLGPGDSLILQIPEPINVGEVLVYRVEGDDLVDFGQHEMEPTSYTCIEVIHKTEPGAASDLDVTYTGTGGTLRNVMLLSNPPGCPPPTIEVISGNTVHMDWGEPCVDSCEVVEYMFTVDYECNSVQPPSSVNWSYPTLPCDLIQDQNAPASYFGSFAANDAVAKYFDPELYCDPPAYPYKIHDVEFYLYDFAGVGSVDIRIDVHEVSDDSCDGPGTQIYLSDPITVTDFYPDWVHLDLPEQVCVNGPFFISIEYASGQTGSTPSFLFDDDVFPCDTCHAWVWYESQGYSPPWWEWSDFWAPPVPGCPIIRVTGFTQHPHCEPYICADCNGDSAINIADVSYLINYLFIGGPAPDPLCIGDANCDTSVNIADASYLINYLFIGGPPACTECCRLKGKMEEIPDQKFERDFLEKKILPQRLPEAIRGLKRIK